MEESECRNTEIKKDLYEFERDIGKSALNPQTNNYVSEKITRYLEDKLRTRVCRGMVVNCWVVDWGYSEPGFVSEW